MSVWLISVEFVDDGKTYLFIVWSVNTGLGKNALQDELHGQTARDTDKTSHG